MDDDETNPLAFVETNALLDELGRRCDAAVWVGLLKIDDSDTEQGMTFQFHGSRWTCIGLMSDAVDLLKKRTPLDAEDDE